MTQHEALEVLQSGRNVFLTGEPGAGKTFTINLFTDWMNEVGKDYAITASTGIAATHINGTTIHSWTGLGISREVNDQLLGKLNENRWLYQRLNQCDVLIIDEISMLDKVMINNIDYILRYMRDRNEPFGGLQIVFVGDFFQLPPVVKGEKAVEFAFESGAWKEADPIVCYLTEQHRQNDLEFLEILSAIRRGETTDAHKARLLECFKNNPNMLPELYTHNMDVDRINQEQLRKLTGEPHRFEMSGEGTPFLVSKLKDNCLSPEILDLKVGAAVMFTRNLFNPETKEAIYVNGTIGRVTGFSEMSGRPEVELIEDGSIVVPMPAKWEFEEKGHVVASITQIPLKLAWAITVHKSQGMSLDSASIDLSKTFEYGQGYVALSRVRSLGKLHLKGINDKVFLVHPKIIEQDKIFKSQSK